MAVAGRILFIPKGEYDESVTYGMLDLVNHNGASWVAKKTVVGIEPSGETSEYWHPLLGLAVPNDSATENFSHAYMTSEATFARKNGLVTVNYTGNWNSGVPEGDLGTLFTIPEEYRPSQRVDVMCFPNNQIMISVWETGQVTAQNYGTEILEIIEGRFNASYIAAE